MAGVESLLTCPGSVGCSRGASNVLNIFAGGKSTTGIGRGHARSRTAARPSFAVISYGEDGGLLRSSPVGQLRTVHKCNGANSFFSPAIRSLGHASAPGERTGVSSVSAGRGYEGGQILELEEGKDELEVLDIDDGNGLLDGGDYYSDVELQNVVQDIAAIERQSDAVAQQMTEHARMLAEASRKLRARAQATRLEAAKLKKVARLQQAEEFRRREEVRVGRVRSEEDARKQQRQQQEQMLMLQQQLQDMQLKLLEQQQRQHQEKPEEEDDGQETSENDAERKMDQPGEGKVVNGFAVPSGSNGAAIATLGAAVLPFAFPNGKHSGSGIDSALVCGPTVEVVEHGPPPVAVPSSAQDSAVVHSHHTGIMEIDAGQEFHSPVEPGSGENSNWQVTEDYECEIAHPGAMSCTKVAVKKDTVGKVAVVAMETTVRCTGDGCLVQSLDTEDFAALAMATLAEHANQLKHSQRFQGAPADADPRMQQHRREIVELLAEGEVIECKPMEPPSKFGHESFIVDLRNKTTGNQMRAMFKPRVEGDADGWHRAPVEWVAYELNLLLGMDYIPPVAYRKGGIDLGKGRKYKEGAFIYWVPNIMELRDVPAPSWGVSVARLLSDTRILDILLNNSDRHHGHFLFGEHWTDGRKGVVLIDHAAGFRKEASVTMEHENAFQTGAVKCVAAHTYLRLRFLDRALLDEKFRDMLSSKEISGLVERKDKVLEYLDRLVQERGYHRTVVE